MASASPEGARPGVALTEAETSRPGWHCPATRRCAGIRGRQDGGVDRHDDASFIVWLSFDCALARLPRPGRGRHTVRIWHAGGQHGQHGNKSDCSFVDSGVLALYWSAATSMEDIATLARELSRITSKDRGLDSSIQARAAYCELLCAQNRSLIAMQRLTELYEEVAPNLPTTTPDADYARCISLLAFWRHNLATAIKKGFRVYEPYKRLIENAANPETLLTGHLGADPIVKAENSWLIPAQEIIDMTSEQIKRRLKITADPPYVVMIFPKAKMQSVGLEVRQPCSIDTIPRHLIHWRQGDVPDERIDRDIPRAALGRLEWRP